MFLTNNFFTKFKADISEIELPEKFTFPFYYDPHPLSLIASKELQDHIVTQQDWNHDFGDEADQDSFSIGKMFGVLVVQNDAGEVGYLSAFSGKLAEGNHHKGFVPPVFDMLQEGNFFLEGMKALNVIQLEVRAVESIPEYHESLQHFKNEQEESKKAIAEEKSKIKKAKSVRKAKRLEAKESLSENELEELTAKLAEESQLARIKLKNLIRYWKERNEQNQSRLSIYTDDIKKVKDKRATFSANLQQGIFDSYKFLNAHGDLKSLNDIFTTIPATAGAGECAAPKLLQFAFLHNLKPICLAEFWWGKSPKSAIRKHGNFYPACRSKCEPILGHMLQGLEVEENPLLKNQGINKKIKILYEDDYILAINKPEDLLSVPGVIIKDSVSDRIERMYKDQPGPFVVHRLDMSTSGVMIFSKTKAANRGLQKQFMNHTIEKTYVAVLEGYLKQDSGVINLPIRLDLDDRPKQLVDHEHGKKASTKYQVIERKGNSTRVHFYPITGRTHQLRVHSAHQEGLGHPIVGDDLYGTKADRLHLHAESIRFAHPITKKEIYISSNPQF